MAGPAIDDTVYQASGSVVTGDVTMGEDCGVWHNAVIRGDEDSVTVGARSNIQDNATVHVDPGFPVTIGEGVTVGHNAIVHGCTVGDNTLVGMGAIILDGARIGRDCIIGAGALVTQGTVVPDGTVWMGCPAKQAREMRTEDVEANERNASVYVRLARDARAKELVKALVPAAG